MSVSPIPPIPLDVILCNVCSHLSVYDLCRLMQCSRDCFNVFLSDRAFSHIKRRILKYIPAYTLLFSCRGWDEHCKKVTIKPSQAKKHKKAFAMPRRGTWYVIKCFLYPMTNVRTIGPYLNKNSQHETWLMRAFLWGICTDSTNCTFRLCENRSWGKRILYKFHFANDRDHYVIVAFGKQTVYLCTREVQVAELTTFSTCIGEHTSADVLNRCLGLFMGIDWPDVQGNWLRHMVGETGEWEPEPEVNSADFESDQSWGSYLADSSE